MQPLAIWLEASRPKTLIISLTPVLTGTLLAWKTSSVSWVTFMFTLLAALGIQIGTNLANDYFDFIKGADTSERKGARRVTQSGLISLPAMRKGIFFAFAGAALCSCYLTFLGGPAIGALSILSIVLGLGYTAGPWPLAYTGLADIFVLIFFGPIATAGAYYLQTQAVSSSAIVLGFCCGFIPTAIITANNLRDVNEDRRCNKKTLCVRFGESFSRAEYTFCLAAACLLPCFYGHYLPLLTLAPAFIPLKAIWTEQDKMKLNIAFGQTGKLLILFTCLLSLSIVGSYGF